jgi:ribosomal protein S12 methylthiotransferase
MEVQSEISFRKNQRLVGTVQKVLFDRVEGDYFIGRTQYDSPEVDNEVLVSKKNHFVQLGNFANVKITRAEHFDLYGDPQ